MTMEENDLKQVWKGGVQKEISGYSPTELNEMVLKSARKSMKAIQPTGAFQVIVIVVMALCVWNIFFRHQSFEMRLLDAAGLLILSVCYFFWKRSAYKMNRYTSNKPMKEWLEDRIREVEKTTKRRRVYNILTLAAAFILGFSFYIVSQVLLKVPFNPWVSGSLFIVLLIYLVVVQHSLRKKYRKTLEELEALHKQFEE